VLRNLGPSAERPDRARLRYEVGSTKMGPAVSAALGGLGTDVSAEVSSVSFQYGSEVVIDLATLRPDWVRTERIVSAEGKDGQRKQQIERHTYEFDWATATTD